MAAFTNIRALFASFLAAAVVTIPGCSDGDGNGAVALRPVTASVHAEGTARLAGRRLEVRVTGLPPRDGTYVVWLFNTATDAVGVARVARGSFALRTRLPVVFWTGSAPESLPAMIRADERTRIVDKAAGTSAFEDALAWALASTQAA